MYRLMWRMFRTKPRKRYTQPIVQQGMFRTYRIYRFPRGTGAKSRCALTAAARRNRGIRSSSSRGPRAAGTCTTTASTGQTRMIWPPRRPRLDRFDEKRRQSGACYPKACAASPRSIVLALGRRPVSSPSARLGSGARGAVDSCRAKASCMCTTRSQSPSTLRSALSR